MTEHDLIDKMNRTLMIPVWKNRDFSVLAHICAPDIDVKTTFVTGKGLEAARKSIEELFRAFPTFELKIEEIIQQGKSITYKWSAVAEHRGTILNIPPTGKRLDFHGIAFIEMNHGVAVKYHSYSNMPQVLYASCVTESQEEQSSILAFPNHASLLDHENYEKEISDLLFIIAKKTDTRLTRRELECLNYWVKGYSIKETARQLGGLSVKTIQVFRDNIRKKFNVISYQNLVHKLEKTGTLSLFLNTPAS
jgi:DNA-binding CsgD family transcriptional regulator/predicted ester cyclase